MAIISRYNVQNVYSSVALSKKFPTNEHLDLVCADCGSSMRLRTEGFERFYGCTAESCSGSLPAYEDGTPMGWPGNAATRAARQQLARQLEATPIYYGEEGEGGVPYGHRYRWCTLCEVLAIGDNGFRVDELSQDQCERAIEALRILGKPSRTRWDHLRLEALVPHE